MFKKPNYYVVNGYSETARILESQLKKLDDLKKSRALTKSEQDLYERINHLLAQTLVDAISYVTKNVNFPKRFWRKIAKKITK